MSSLPGAWLPLRGIYTSGPKLKLKKVKINNQQPSDERKKRRRNRTSLPLRGGSYFLTINSLSKTGKPYCNRSDP